MPLKLEGEKVHTAGRVLRGIVGPLAALSTGRGRWCAGLIQPEVEWMQLNQKGRQLAVAGKLLASGLPLFLSCPVPMNVLWCPD